MSVRKIEALKLAVPSEEVCSKHLENKINKKWITKGKELNQIICISCQREYKKSYYKKNRDKLRKQNLLDGLTKIRHLVPKKGASNE